MRTHEPPPRHAHLPTAARVLPAWRRPLAVVAHPDDESFGLGAILTGFVAQGAEPSVLCFTHGEASTLHGVPGDLRQIRATELDRAAGLLGVHDVDLHDEVDGALSGVTPDTLTATLTRAVTARRSDGLLVFDVTGVTGHADHVAATRTAVTVGRHLGLDVLAWTLPEEVASQLNTELGTAFAGRPAPDITLRLTVDRSRQLEAVHAHPSQAIPGSALWRRLELLGDTEHLLWLHRSPGGPTGPSS